MIKLTYPRSHKIEDLRELYEDFKAENPNIFCSWLEIEQNWSEGSELKIKHIMINIHEFLKSRTQWQSLSAVISASGDFRRILRSDIDK